MPENDSDFNRYLNPFEVKVGVDTLPNFVPPPHYLQLKSLCNEAYLKICTKVPLVYSIKENRMLKFEEILEIIFNKNLQEYKLEKKRTFKN